MTPQELKKEMQSDYPLISMSDITDEARLLAIAWHENATDWIGDKHKLASDIINYARRHNQNKSNIYHSRAFGLIQGTIKGIKQLGGDADLDGIVKSLNEALELLKK